MIRHPRWTLAAALLLGLVAAPARADGKPIQLALLNPVQIFPERESIGGLRLSLLYGKNVNVEGVDLALIAAHSTGNGTGLQWAAVSLTDRDFTGWQSGFVDITGGKMTGFQWGLYNQASRVEGLQLGLVNKTDTIHGLQIGLVNIISRGGWFPVFVIVNGNFG